MHEPMCSVAMRNNGYCDQDLRWSQFELRIALILLNILKHCNQTVSRLNWIRRHEWMGLDALSNDAMQSDMMKSNKYDRR